MVKHFCDMCGCDIIYDLGLSVELHNREYAFSEEYEICTNCYDRVFELIRYFPKQDGIKTKGESNEQTK